jgi:anti-sigma factor RsiW
MRCRRIQHYLLALSEGELDQRTHGKVATHVAACPACAAALRSLQQTLHMIRDLDMPEPAAAFWEEFVPALHQRIRREAAAQPERRRFRVRDIFVLPKPVLAALAVSLILASSLPLMHWPWGQRALPRVVLSMGEEASLTADLDLLKNLDLLEDVDALEQLDASF